ncbi:hypothetical protein [Bradyrhizobium sp. NAS80.1]|nr:hypothetical protein [Bradyrhizobium sp. NAS80.1]
MDTYIARPGKNADTAFAKLDAHEIEKARLAAPLIYIYVNTKHSG